MPEAGKFERMPFVRELARQFEALGIRLKTRNFRNPDELREVRQPFFVLWERGMDFPDAENVIRPLFGKSSAFRWLTANVPGPDFDRLLEAADREAGRAKRLELFREMETMIRHDVPGVPLFTVEQRMAVQPDIRGLRIPPLGAMYIDLREVVFVK